jgi:C4-dicarboxylate-specific signal transduction histidine kinase
MADLDDEKLDELVRQQEKSNQIMWALVGLYVALLIGVAIASFFALRRINELQESSLSKLGKNAGDFSETIKKSKVLPKIINSITDMATASMKQATATMKADATRTIAAEMNSRAPKPIK